MEKIKKCIQILWEWLKIHKKKWLAFTAIFIFFFLILFPYEEVVSYFINKLNINTKNSVQLQYESFYINPLGPCIVFKKPEIFTKMTQNSIIADQLKLRPSYKSLLQFKMGGIITLKWPSSLLNIIISKKQKEDNASDWHIHIKSPYFNLSDFRFFSPLFNKIKGIMNIDIKMLLDPNFTRQPEGQWNINSHYFQSQALSYTFPGSIGNISLPAFKWSQINLQGKIKKGDITVSDISLGDKKDTFQLKTRGIISIDFLKQRASQRIRSRLKSYHLGLDILVNKDLKPKLSFLSIFLPSIESQTPQGWRYLGEVRGNMRNFDIFRTETLPTLQKIQNPEITKETL